GRRATSRVATPAPISPSAINSTIQRRSPVKGSVPEVAVRPSVFAAPRTPPDGCAALAGAALVCEAPFTPLVLAGGVVFDAGATAAVVDVVVVDADVVVVVATVVVTGAGVVVCTAVVVGVTVVVVGTVVVIVVVVP